MATPAVAGAVAVLRGALMNMSHIPLPIVKPDGQPYGASNPPPSAVLKALLVGSSLNVEYGYTRAGTQVQLAE